MDSTRRIVRGGGTGLTSSSRFSALLLYEHEKRIKRLKRWIKMVPIRTDHGKTRTKLFLKKPTGQLMTLILQTPIFFKIELKFVYSFFKFFYTSDI